METRYQEIRCHHNDAGVKMRLVDLGGERRWEKRYHNEMKMMCENE